MMRSSNPVAPDSTGWYSDAEGKRWYWTGDNWWADWSERSATQQTYETASSRTPEERPRAAPRAKEAEKPVKKEEKPEGKKVRTKTEPEPSPSPHRNPGGRSSGSRRPPEPERPPQRTPMRGGERPQKKSRAAPDPPDPGSEPDWDDEDEYTYEYEEEGDEQPESERRTTDPTVSVSDAPARPAEPANPPLRLRPRPGQEQDRRRPGDPDGGDDGGGGHGGRDDASDVSTARTSEMREILLRQSRRDGGDRSKPSLSQVRIEPFKGSRSHYKEWRRTLEAQRALYRLDEGELAMLVYLSTQGEPRAILDQLEIQEMREPGGLQRVLRLLDDAFGSRADERFEERQEAYLSYRRAAGTSMSAYISTLKRLRSEFLKEDDQTVISDKSFAQRLLSRASLTRRERMDVFYAAGGKYASANLEKVLRFRCAHIHEEERRNRIQGRSSRAEDSHRPSGRKKQFVPKRSEHRRSSKPSRHSAHVAENDEPNDEYDDEQDEEEDPDQEDLEQEALHAREDREGEDEFEEVEVETENSEWDNMSDLREAYAAGWRAKQKSAEQRKARGYSGGKGKSSKGRGKGETRSIDQRKKKSKCSSCGQTGHWHGDAQCPNVKSGQDPLRDPSAAASSSVNYNANEASPSSRRDEESGGARMHRVNWTYVVDNGWDLLQDYDSELEDSSSDDTENDLRPVALAAAAKAESKSSGSRRRRYKVALKSVLEALAEDTSDEEVKKKLKKKEHKAAREEEERQRRAKTQGKLNSRPTPMETELPASDVLKILPHLTKQEKKDLYKKLKKEQEEEAASYLDPHLNAEKLKRVERRTSGYSAMGPGRARPKETASPARASGTARSSRDVERPKESEPPASVASGELPEPVRKKRLAEFRWGLYENSLDRKGRARPSEASGFPTPEQEQCRDDWADLRWGANGAARWANCRACGLKKVLYYSNDHGALVVLPRERVANMVWMLDGGKSTVILDTGCRTAVAGALWHRKFQEELRSRNLPWEEVPHEEVFRFGAGAPVVSTRAMLYPVALGNSGVLSWLRLALVENTASDPRV